MTGHVIDLTRLEKLTLPGGTPAASLRVGPLFAELSRLDIPGINTSMGKSDLLGAYEAALILQAEATARATDVRWKGPTDANLRRAAEDVGRA